ncbi:hypothetical protein OAK75_04985, partial [Bacteriovoracales bacterium]|nr:hypothetical protein [Bacteriovoracales bacterium]
EWKKYMPVSKIQEEAPILKKQLMKTKLKVLIPLIEKVKEKSEKFDIKMIDLLLSYFIEKFENY